MINFKVDYKKMILVGLLLVITSFMVSGSVYLFTVAAEENISQTRNVEISALEDQLVQLRDAIRTREVFERNDQVLGSQVKAIN